MLKMVPYLFFNGNCGEAMAYYVETLGAEQKVLTRYGDYTDPTYEMPAEAADLVMHGELRIDGERLFFSDEFPFEEFGLKRDVSIAFVSPDSDMLKDMYDALAPEADEILVEFEETEWSPGYGMLRDKFGVKWQFDTGETN